MKNIATSLKPIEILSLLKTYSAHSSISDCTYSVHTNELISNGMQFTEKLLRYHKVSKETKIIYTFFKNNEYF